MALRPYAKAIPVVLLCTLLAACGSSRFERGASGAGIGSLAGAGVAAVAGGPVLVGAAIGAAGGAAVGVLTSECDVDLGPQRANSC